MNRALSLLSWILLAALAAPSRADEVQLKNGSKIEGTVREDGNKVIIDVGSGTITVDRSDVRGIHRPDGEIQEFDRRVQGVRPDDANGYYQVSLWARQQPGMKTRSDRLLQKVLELDPNHEGARRALGYVNHKGAWLTQEEYKGAIGLVRYQGEWVSADAAERLRRIDQELALAQSKRAAEDDRLQQQLSLEREKIAQRQRVLDMLRTGDLPRDFFSAFGYPWAMRYWGPASAAAPQPNAD